MKIHVLKEGLFSVNKDKVFTNVTSSEKKGSILVGVQPFLVESLSGLILLDAGLGCVEEGIPKIHSNILKTLHKPEMLSIILLSHLHKDHISGLVNKENNNWKLNFPNAKIYIQKREFDFAMSNQNNPSYDLEILDYISDNAQIVWLKEDYGMINSEVSYEVSGGHTPFHQVFYIRENGETCFYGADNLPTADYLKYQITFKRDFDGKRAMKSRIIWKNKAKIEHWKILFYHDLKLESISL